MAINTDSKPQMEMYKGGEKPTSYREFCKPQDVKAKDSNECCVVKFDDKSSRREVTP